MANLTIILTPKNEQEFDVYALNYGQTSSKLPFFENNQDYRSTLICILEITADETKSYQSQWFSDNEQNWLIKAGIVDDQRQQFLDYPTLLKNLGQQLYQSLFPQGSKVEEAFKRAYHKEEKLHLQLQFEADSVGKNRLADYPWELMHNGAKFLLWDGVSIYRYIAYQDAPPQLKPVEQVNVLLVSSEASDHSQGLNQFSRSERQAIAEGLKLAQQEGKIKLIDLAQEINNIPTFKTLQTYLTEHRGENQPHVLHFDGHGIYGKKCQKCQKIYAGTKLETCNNSTCQNQPLLEAQGYLVFEDEQGQPDYISAETLAVTLKNMTSHTQEQGRLTVVVLSACQSGMAVAGESVFNGTAQKLISYSIPAVVAMQYSVKVKEATQFAQQFYTALGQKDSLAKAVSQARIAMGIEGNQWYRPVLYLRWQDNEGGQLFKKSQELNISTVTNKNIYEQTGNFGIGNMSGGVIQNSEIIGQKNVYINTEKPDNIITTPPNNLPLSGAKDFIGRDEALETLHQKRQTGQQVAILRSDHSSTMEQKELERYKEKYAQFDKLSRKLSTNITQLESALDTAYDEDKKIGIQSSIAEKKAKLESYEQELSSLKEKISSLEKELSRNC